MPSKADIQQIKDTLQANKTMYVKGDVWPHGSSRLLVIGSHSSNMNANAFADSLYEYLGIVATPLPKKAGLTNLYSFVVYKATPTAQLYDETAGDFVDVPVTSDLVEACFGGATPIVDYKVAFVGLGVLEAKVSPKEVADAIEAADKWAWLSDDDETPLPFDHNAALAPNTWVYLRVDFALMNAIPPKGLKTLLEASDSNYKAIDPISGISGFFERMFSGSEYVGESYSHVLFNPGNAMGVTAAKLQSTAFSAYAGKAYVSAFTTLEIVENQSSLDTFYAVQGTEEAAGDAAASFLAALQKALKSVKYVLWGAAGLGILWVGWQGFKYIGKEKRAYKRG